MGNYKLFLDDERWPPANRSSLLSALINYVVKGFRRHNDWVIARNYDEAISIMEEHGCPYYMSFDHDLGIYGAVEKTGKHVAEWMVERDLNYGNFFPDNFDFYVHSQNSVGAENIKKYLTNYFEICYERQ